MCPSVRLCLLLLLSVMVSVSGRRSDRLTDSSSSSSVSRIKLEPFWTGETFRPRGEELVDFPAVPEQDVMLTDPSEPGDVAIAGRRRSARGADQQDEEQQSTFGQSYENDSVTTPRDTDFDADNNDNNATELTPPASDEDAAGTILDDENAGDSGRDAANNNNNGSSPGLFFNPFYPLEKEGSYVAYAVLFLGGTVLAVGVVGNMAVMCVVWNNYYMRSAWNYLLASMAFWDFLVLVLCLPVVVINQLSHRRILGDITCRMVPYMEVTSLGITSFSLCALGVDRFTAATSSTAPKARRVARCRSVLLKLLLVWLTALMLSSPELFLWQLTRTMSLASGATVDSCSLTPPSPLSLYLPDYLHSLLLRYHQARMWWCFGAYFCLPVLFTALCQLATCNVNSDYDSTHKKRLPVCGDDPLSGQKRAQQQSAERQLGCTVLALAVVYGVCALPEHVVSITLAYARVDVSTDTAAMLALLRHFLLFFKCSVTPVLLLCLCKALGQHFMDCCCCCCQECQPDTPPGTPSSAQVKLKTANEVASSSIFFDKAKETSAILSISS